MVLKPYRGFRGDWSVKRRMYAGSPKFTLHISLSNLEIARRNPVVEGPEKKLDSPIALANVLSILPEMDEQS